MRRQRLKSWRLKLHRGLPGEWEVLCFVILSSCYPKSVISVMIDRLGVWMWGLLVDEFLAVLHKDLVLGVAADGLTKQVVDRSIVISLSSVDELGTANSID